MESILNAPPRRPIPVRRSEIGGLRASIVLVVVGLLAVALGGMMYAAAAASGGGNGNEPLVLEVGSVFFGLGAIFFLWGILAEFFAIGTSLRSIAECSEAALPLLYASCPSPSDAHTNSAVSRSKPAGLKF